MVEAKTPVEFSRTGSEVEADAGDSVVEESAEDLVGVARLGGAFETVQKKHEHVTTGSSALDKIEIEKIAVGRDPPLSSKAQSPFRPEQPCAQRLSVRPWKPPRRIEGRLLHIHPGSVAARVSSIGRRRRLIGRLRASESAIARAGLSWPHVIVVAPG